MELNDKERMAVGNFLSENWTRFESFGFTYMTADELNELFERFGIEPTDKSEETA